MWTGSNITGQALGGYTNQGAKSPQVHRHAVKMGVTCMLCEAHLNWLVYISVNIHQNIGD